MSDLPKPSEIIASIRAIGGTSSLTPEQLRTLDEAHKNERNRHVAEPFRTIVNVWSSQCPAREVAERGNR